MNGHSLSQGFSLLELAIVLIVIGMVLSMVNFSYSSALHASAVKKTTHAMSEVQQTLLFFALGHHRLPCADTDANGYEGSGIPGACGAASANQSGLLPYKTLALDSEPLDASHQPFRYGVYRNSTANADLVVNVERTGDSASSEQFTNTSDFIRALQNAQNIGTVQSSLYVTGNGINTGLEQCSGNLVTNVAYVLISGGYDDLDGINGFFDGANGLFGTGLPVCASSPTRLASNAYDDHVVVESFVELSGKLLQ